MEVIVQSIVAHFLWPTGYNQLPVNCVKKRNPLIVRLFINHNKDQSLQQLSVRLISIAQTYVKYRLLTFIALIVI